MEYERAKPKLARHGEPMELETALLESKEAAGRRRSTLFMYSITRIYGVFTKEHLVLF